MQRRYFVGYWREHWDEWTALCRRQKEVSLMRTRSNGRRLLILGFHKIGEPPRGVPRTSYYIPETTFAGYLSLLRENGWRIISLATFLKGLKEKDSLPPRAALLTFDDGYRSMREVVLPMLLQFRCPAVLFVPTDFIGGSSEFDSGVEPKEPICSWRDLRELGRWGVSVQSHGASHRPFSELGPAELEEELLRSKAVLESRLRRAVEVFAYPYGDDGVKPSVVKRALLRTGYRAACLFGGGPIHLPVTDPFRLPRLAMEPSTNLLGILARHKPPLRRKEVGYGESSPAAY